MIELHGMLLRCDRVAGFVCVGVMPCEEVGRRGAFLCPLTSIPQGGGSSLSHVHYIYKVWVEMTARLSPLLLLSSAALRPAFAPWGGGGEPSDAPNSSR